MWPCSHYVPVPFTSKLNQKLCFVNWNKKKPKVGPAVTLAKTEVTYQVTFTQSALKEGHLTGGRIVYCLSFLEMSNTRTYYLRCTQPTVTFPYIKGFRQLGNILIYSPSCNCPTCCIGVDWNPKLNGVALFITDFPILLKERKKLEFFKIPLTTPPAFLDTVEELCSPAAIKLSKALSFPLDAHFILVISQCHKKQILCLYLTVIQD